MRADRLDQVLVDALQRVERCHRVLEDHRDVPPSDLGHLSLTLLHEVLAVEPNLTTHDLARLRYQAHDRAAHCRLAARRLAYQAQCLPSADGQVHVIDTADRASPHRILYLQVRNLKQLPRL